MFRIYVNIKLSTFLRHEKVFFPLSHLTNNNEEFSTCAWERKKNPSVTRELLLEKAFITTAIRESTHVWMKRYNAIVLPKLFMQIYSTRRRSIKDYWNLDAHSTMIELIIENRFMIMSTYLRRDVTRRNINLWLYAV